ncbi:MAG: Na/Pi cotransporter family protein [Flavobacteriaceae bacterium]|nr:Na/Pi symporter [Bacteroidia bacterium]NND10194.1 Na/Pi cotransporter family protein [Flavobacteriaceae bacterium]NNL60939.1 Na/Pi cotransporter family protein [Flavobacteriaceae bacterium]
MQESDIISILPTLIGGLVVFLYAIRRLSIKMEDFFSEKARDFIASYTKNVFKAIIVGIVVTVLLDSSSAVIIITIVLVNSGALDFKQAMGIVMGANIGTTFSSQIIAMNVNKYSVILMMIGLLIWMFSKSIKVKKTAEVLMYFGMLFFGLFLLEISVHPLRDSEFFTSWMLEMSKPLKGAITGGLVTLIIQSSSATVAMLITLAKQNLIGLSAAIAAMLGAELGTCSDTLLAVIGGKRDAIRTGVFHLVFNFIPITLGLLLFDHFVDLAKWISGETPISRQIANAHVLFSVLSVLLFLPFVNTFHKAIRFIIPDKANAHLA